MGRKTIVGIAAAALLLAAAAVTFWSSTEPGPEVAPSSVPPPSAAAPANPVEVAPPAAAAPTLPAAVADGTVLGRLVRGAPPRPIAGRAEILGRPGSSATSGSDGRFRIDGLPRGEPLILVATAEGLPETRVEEIRITAEGPFDCGYVRLGPADGIRVLVRDSTERPAAGATVSLHRARPVDLGKQQPPSWDGPDVPGFLLPAAASTTTDAAGAASFPSVVPGDWLVRASAPGHAAEVIPAWVREGYARSAMEFHLRPGFRLHGTVLGPDGRAVAGARLAAWKPDGNPNAPFRGAGEVAVSDAAGAYSIDGLPVGSVSIWWFPGADSARGLGRVLLPVIGAYDVRLPSAGTLAGTVVEAGSGLAVAGARVTLTRSAGHFESGLPCEAAAVTDLEGAFRLDGIPEDGEGSVRVEREGYLPFPPAEKRGQGRARELVRKGDAGARIELQRGTVLRGRVSTTGGEAVADAVVWALPHLGRNEFTSGSANIGTPTRRVRSGPDGSYRIDAVPPGRVFLLAESPGFHQEHSNAWLRSIDAGNYGAAIPEPLVVEVPEGAETVRDLVLLRGGTVEGNVVDAAGKSLAGFIIRVGTMTEGEEGEGEAGPTDAEGRFLVRGVIPGPQRFVWACGPNGEQGWSAKFDLAEEQRVSDVKVAIRATPAGAILAGTVRFEDGTPAPGAEIRLSPWPATEYVGFWDETRPLAVTSSDGAYRIEGLQKGEATLLVRGPGLAPTAGPRVALSVGETKEGVAVVVPRELTLSGRVLDPEGRPVSGAAVRVSPAKPDEKEPELDYQFGGSHGNGPRVPLARRATATTGADGQFTQGGLRAGDVWIEADAPGLLEAWVRARAGDSAAEVRLGAAASISGKVVEAATGAPAAGVPIYWQEPAGDRVSEESEWIHSAADGSFRIDGLGPGEFRINFASHMNEPDLPWREQDVDGVKSGTTDLVVRLERGLVLSGRLTDQAGNPVAKASVRISSSKENRGSDFFMGDQTVSEEDGSFRFAGLEEGMYGIQVGHGFGGTASPGDQDIVLTVARGLAAGSEDVAIRVMRGLRISGRVVGPDGKPARGQENRGSPRVEAFEVGRKDEEPDEDEEVDDEHLEGSRQNPLTIFVRDGKSSEFESPPLKPGTTWDLVASEFREGPFGTLRGVAAGTRDVVIRIQPGCVIEGRVLEEGGAPAPAGVRVEAEKVDGGSGHGERQYTETDAQGRFRIEALVEGEFTLQVDEYRETYLPLAEPLRVKSGTTGITVTVRRGAAISGKVVDAEGNPVRHPSVREKEGKRARSEGDGSFVLGGLDPGAEVVLVLDARNGEDIEAGSFKAPTAGIVIRLPKQ